MIFENFVERRKHSELPILNLQCWEILPIKKQMFHSEFIYAA